jgi:hypothetical protein
VDPLLAAVDLPPRRWPRRLEEIDPAYSRAHASTAKLASADRQKMPNGSARLIAAAA